MSEGNAKIDEDLKMLEKDIAKEYLKARRDLKKDIVKYFSKFKEQDEEKKKEVEEEKISNTEYKRWRMQTMMSGKEYEELRDEIAERYLKANKESVKKINQKKIGVYCDSRNYSAYLMETSINGKQSRV